MGTKSQNALNIARKNIENTSIQSPVRQAGSVM